MIKLVFLGLNAVICDKIQVSFHSSHTKMLQDNHLSRVFGQVGTQLLYVSILPAFFAAFVLLYEPFQLDTYLNMGSDWFSFNLTIVTVIIMLMLFITRTVFYFIYRRHVVIEGWYICWCCIEVLVINFAVTLYLWLMMKGCMHEVPTYFALLKKDLFILSFALIIPYVGIGLALRVYHRKDYLETTAQNSLLKFVDASGAVRLAVPNHDILYVEAKENYINLCYEEKGKVKYYLLRNTMKSIEQLPEGHTLVRCHRSYFVNARRVKILRKDPTGIIHADLDAPTDLHVQVSRSYYNALSEIL